MQEKFNGINNEIWNFILKTLPFAMAALIISIGVQIKRKTATITGVLLSVAIGLAGAWLTGGYINTKFSPSIAPLAIGFVTIITEKLGYWAVYQFNVDTLAQAGVDWLVNYLKRKKK